MIAFDRFSGAAEDNDPALAAMRSDMSLGRHIRVDLAHLSDWVLSAL